MTHVTTLSHTLLPIKHECQSMLDDRWDLLCYALILNWVQVKKNGPEQGPGPHPFDTAVPYPRSIPVWRIRSIPLIHALWYIYIYIFINVYLNMCSLIWHVYAHTWADTYMSVYMQEYVTMPKPCDCVGKSVPYSCYLITLLCDCRDVLGCCQLAV